MIPLEASMDSVSPDFYQEVQDATMMLANAVWEYFPNDRLLAGHLMLLARSDLRKTETLVTLCRLVWEMPDRGVAPVHIIRARESLERLLEALWP